MSGKCHFRYNVAILLILALSTEIIQKKPKEDRNYKQAGHACRNQVSLYKLLLYAAISLKEDSCAAFIH